METKRLKVSNTAGSKTSKAVEIVGLFSFSQLKKSKKTIQRFLRKPVFKNFEDNNLQAKGFLLLCFTLKKKPRGTKEERTFGATVV